MRTLAYPQSVSLLLNTSFDEQVLQRAILDCRTKLGGDPDLVIAFVSSDYRPRIGELIECLRIDGHSGEIIGSSAMGLFGVGKAAENTAGVSLLFLRLPKTELAIFTNTDLDQIPSSHPQPDGIVILSDPLLDTPGSCTPFLSTRFPNTPILGTQLSGGPEAEDLFLFTKDGIQDCASLTLLLCGGIELEPMLAQACRPIGDPMIVTGVNKSAVTSIGSREPLTVLEETFATLPDQDRELAAGNIFAGLAIREEVEEFEPGDFLVRHIVGADLEDGQIHLASLPRVGQTLQFQLRSASVAREVLKNECERILKTRGLPFGALIFAGRARGQDLFEAENSDISIFGDTFGPVPIAGLFGNGEFAPVRGVPFRHDHSFTGALFYAKP